MSKRKLKKFIKGASECYESSIAEAWEKYYHARLKLFGMSDVSGLPCKCGNMIFTHRHSNWIECTVCHKIQILQA